MYLESYKYIAGAPIVEELKRDKYMTPQYIKMLKPYIESLKLDKGAFLHAAGPSIHHSDARNIKDLSPKSSIPIKSQTGLNTFTIAKMIPGVEYASINSNTCASSMYSLHEAKRLLDEGYTDVVIYADEMREPTQLLLFEQLGLDVECADGVVIAHFTKEPTETSKAMVVDTTWKWNPDESPMSVSKEGYCKVLKDIGSPTVDYVKLHGTGTDRNTLVEQSAIVKTVGYVKTIGYKQDIGHTQGASALLELCMTIEEDKYRGKDIIALASGLGGFYGGIRYITRL